MSSHPLFRRVNVKLPFFSVTQWWKRWWCNHEWVSFKRHRSHDIGLDVDQCKHCGEKREWVG